MTKTNGKLYHKSMIESLAKKSGLSVRWLKTDGEWNWHVTNGDMPCFRGDAMSVVLWLQGYRRAVEDHKKIDTWAELAATAIEYLNKDLDLGTFHELTETYPGDQ